LIRIDWNGRSQFWSASNGLEWTGLVEIGLRMFWIGIEEVAFGLSGMDEWIKKESATLGLA
jgi:hypothetical protein